MRNWQVQEAKQRFSELIQRALDDGPQLVTRHGKAAVVVLSAAEFDRLSSQRSHINFKEFLKSSPDFSLLELDRRDLPREVDF